VLDPPPPPRRCGANASGSADGRENVVAGIDADGALRIVEPPKLEPADPAGPPLRGIAAPPPLSPPPRGWAEPVGVPTGRPCAHADGAASATAAANATAVR
jgi:hypothetical protein